MSKVIPNHAQVRSQIISRLLHQKGIDNYIPIDGSEEASEILPGGIYPVSETILTQDGRVCSLWLGWNEELKDYSLGDERTYEHDGQFYSFYRETTMEEYEKELSHPLTHPSNQPYLDAKQKYGFI